VIIIIVILLWVPGTVFSRLTITTERTASRYVDGRTDTYKKVIEYLPEFVLTGVGVSHFYGDWGMDAGFGLVGTHNIYAEVTVYWGLPGLLALLALVWRAYQCLPRRSSTDPLGLCLLGISVSVMVYSFFTHNLEEKQFSIALGLLAGANHWIWPRTLVTVQVVKTGITPQLAFPVHRRNFVRQSDITFVNKQLENTRKNHSFGENP
jgi:O-antigen ligase